MVWTYQSYNYNRQNFLLSGLLKSSIATSRCVGCTSIIRWCKLHIYTYEVLYIPSRDIYFRRKLRYCPKLKCVRRDWNIRNTASNDYNSETKKSIEISLQSQSIISNEDITALKREGFEICDAKEPWVNILSMKRKWSKLWILNIYWTKLSTVPKIDQYFSRSQTFLMEEIVLEEMFQYFWLLNAFQERFILILNKAEIKLILCFA